MIFTCNIVDWQHSVLGKQCVSSHVLNNTTSILELTDFHDIEGTFFVAASVAERYPSLLREIAANGHEVAAWFDECADLSGAFSPDAERTIKALEDAIGQKVIGARCGKISMNSTLDELDDYCRQLKQLGIKYDSSMHSAKAIRILAKKRARLRTFERYRIAEYHLPFQSILGLKKPLFGGEAFRRLPYEISHRLGKSLPRDNTVFHMHSYDLGVAESHDIIKENHLSRALRKDFRGRKNQFAKLQLLMRDFPFMSFRGAYFFSDHASPFFHSDEQHLISA